MKSESNETLDRAKPPVTVAAVAVFSGLIVALGAIFIPLPFSPVPVTGQTLGVLLAANMLGPFRALASVALVLGLAALGAPVIAGGRGGIGVLLGSSGGYFVGWMVVALVVGWLVQRSGPGFWGLGKRLALNLTFGIFLVYLTGVPWFAFVTQRPLLDAILVGMLPFLIGDTVKAIVAAVVADRLATGYARSLRFLTSRA